MSTPHKCPRGRCFKLTLLLVLLSASGMCGAQLPDWNGGPGAWTGWTTTGSGWHTTTDHLDASEAGDHTAWRSGESEVGTFRSPDFTVQADFLTFEYSGWDGQNGDLKQSAFRLCKASDGSIVREAAPPQSDRFTQRTWIVSDLIGQKVYFEAVDGVGTNGFGWIGLKALRCVQKAVPSTESVYRSIPLSLGTGIWGISSKTGAMQPTTPYLTSLVQGESQVGALVSPAFTLTLPRITLKVRGYDTEAGGKGLNRVELIDAATGAVYRRSAPPQSDWAQTVEWNTTDLSGKQVCIRLVDECTDSGYAWLGLDSVDAGSDFQVDFSKGQEALAGWSAPQADKEYADIDGVPFMLNAQSALHDKGTLEIPLGFKAERLFLAGLTNSIEQGFVWQAFEDRSQRFFVGDRLGEVQVVYENGATDTYPLVLGDNIWFVNRILEHPEPFKSYPHAHEVLEKALNVYPVDPRADHCYLTALITRDQVIKNIRITDLPEKAGAPIIRGLTVEVRKGEQPSGTMALGHDPTAPGLARYLRHKGCRPEGSAKYDAQQRLAQLRNVMYTTADNFPRSVPTSVPEHYRGPVVRFEGTPEAEVMANIFHYNLQDMAEKVDDHGMYHTSTKDAPSWGGYNGIGTWCPGWGSYYSQVWARDMGRALMELIDTGRIDKARLCADYCIMMGQVWEKGPQPEMGIQNIGKPLTLGGQPVPFHWDRRLNYPDTTPGEIFDNDSHGLTMLFFYNLWRRLPDQDKWLRDRWEWIQKGGDWIKWQFDHPDLSGATEYHIKTDSESAGGPGFSIYPDYCCIEGLRGFAEMADSIGKTEKAAEWRATADRLHTGIEKDYPEQDGTYGTVWTLKHSGWPHHSTVLAPVILAPDLAGYLRRDVDQGFLPITEHSYDRVVDHSAETTPRGAYGSAMGYSQGFITQSALLLDRMADAEKMLNWTARLTYYHVPDNEAWCYIVPEGAEIHTDGKYWFRAGDLGNGVQQAEIVKSVRLVLGIENEVPGSLGLYPRMPLGWSKISVADYPVWIQLDGKPERRTISYELKRKGNGMTLHVAFDKTYPNDIAVRLGSFEGLGQHPSTRLNGKHVESKVIESGDSQWLCFKVPAGLKEFNVDAAASNHATETPKQHRGVS